MNEDTDTPSPPPEVGGLSLRVGGWLFRNRGWLPVPPVLACLALAQPTVPSLVAGAVLTSLGESLRLWSVRHIGPISRTRDSSVGELATGGPYRWSRNPLYVGNLLFYAGLGVASWHPSGVGLVALLAVHYSFVVHWEESRIDDTHGSAYTDYRSLVPRWIGLHPGLSARQPRVGCRGAFRSERTTLLILFGVWSSIIGRWFVGGLS